MARILGNSAAVSPVALGGATDHTTLAPPHAARATRPGWRDPRLWIGIAIVAACIVGGARLLGSADDTVGVWALRSDAGAGAIIGRDDLEVRRVHFAAAGDLAAYVRVDAALPSRLSLIRRVGGGELLPRSALASGTATDTVELPLTVDPGEVPPSVRSGSVVDVYVIGADATPAGSGGVGAGDPPAHASGNSSGGGAGSGSAAGSGLATPALSAVSVVSAPTSDDVFGASQTKRQLTLAVPERRAQEFFGLLAGSDDPTITVVLRPAG